MKSKTKTDYIEIAVESYEDAHNEGKKYWFGLCYPTTIEEAKKQAKYQKEIVGRKRLRIVKRTHLIKYELISQ
jgi:hypothetical protein